MESTRRARIEYRTSDENKEQLRQYAEDQGKPVNDILDELVQERLEAEQPADSTEALARRLEKQLKKCEDEFAKRSNEKGVAGMKDDSVYYFAAFLVDEAYKGLNADWQKIRFQALQDFHADPQPAWVRQWGIKSQLQIIEVCRLASDLKELASKRKELTQKLNSLYRNLGAVKDTSKDSPMATCIN
jgi:hypothetical protein